MRIMKASVYKSVLFTSLAILAGWFSASPIRAFAQAGDNAICTASTPAGIKCSASFIDVTALAGADICAKIGTAIALLPAVGGVIDARGANPGTNQTCANSPWNGITTPPPAYIYLPTGSITIPATWVLPDRTRIFGEGRGGTNTSGTTIVAASGFTASTPIIEMGSSACESNTGICFGISVQDLMLDGNNQNVVGILNSHSQEQTYVERVSLHDITGTGLEISGSQAQNSGPYSDLAISPGSSAVAGTVCVQILSVGDTRGIHGLSCTADGTPNAGVLIDSNNNTIEDAHFEGVVDGIRVGSNAAATANVILNVTGGSGAGPMTNVVHVYSTNVVDDLVLSAIHQGSSGIDPIRDDTSADSPLTEASVALYVIGRPVGTNGVSRFTTSPNSVNWGVGGSAPTGSCKVGSLFSNTGGSGATTTLYLCALVSGSPAWVAH
jgi:hypothetical protein